MTLHVYRKLLGGRLSTDRSRPWWHTSVLFPLKCHQFILSFFSFGERLLSIMVLITTTAILILITSSSATSSPGDNFRPYSTGHVDSQGGAGTSAEFGVPDDVLPLALSLSESHPLLSHTEPVYEEASVAIWPTYSEYEPTSVSDAMSTSFASQGDQDHWLDYSLWQPQDSSHDTSEWLNLPEASSSGMMDNEGYLPSYPTSQASSDTLAYSADHHYTTSLTSQPPVTVKMDEVSNATLQQPSEYVFDQAHYASYSGISKGESSAPPRRLFWPPFPPFSWQYKLLKSQVEKIHERITNPWPKSISDRQAKRQLQNVSKWLNSHEDIVAQLTKGDEKVWKMVIERSMPNLYEPAPKPPLRRGRNVCMLEPVWLARPILSTRKDYIVHRLSQHWNGVSDSLVQNRLIAYAGKFGKVSSPEPLLEDDQVRFVIAADAIFCEAAPHGHRNVGAGDDDILHQFSEEYSVPVEGEIGKAAKLPKESIRFSADAARFHTGQSWLDTMPLIQIDKIHKAIRSHWKDRANFYVIDEAFAEVNELLEHDEMLLDRLKKGDKSAAYNVARRCMKPFFMKHPS